MKAGDTVRTARGRRLLILNDSPKFGGEATAYKARIVSGWSDRLVVLKVFGGDMPLKQRVRRSVRLEDLEIAKRCTGLVVPFDHVRGSDWFGHVSDFVEGQNLEDYLATPGLRFPDNTKLAVSLAFGVAALNNQYGIAHGDLHPGNLIVTQKGGRVSLRIIDFDNFACAKAPKPAFLGHLHFMAPEIRKCLYGEGRSLPSERSDRFALACVIYLILLLMTFVDGHAHDQRSFDKAATCGRWLHDPLSNPKLHGDGLPVGVLSCSLQRLFRRAFSLDPDERPTALEWALVLKDAYENLYFHDRCGGFVVVDSSKTVCPHCEERYPFLRISPINVGRGVVVDSGLVRLGREHLKSEAVSRNHAVLRRRGPVTSLEVCGLNGAFRLVQNRWVRLKDGVAVSIERGDRLMFGDVECKVEELS